jgi:hypothetical protein
MGPLGRTISFVDDSSSDVGVAAAVGKELRGGRIENTPEATAAGADARVGEACVAGTETEGAVLPETGEEGVDALRGL